MRFFLLIQAASLDVQIRTMKHLMACNKPRSFFPILVSCFFFFQIKRQGGRRTGYKKGKTITLIPFTGPEELMCTLLWFQSSHPAPRRSCPQKETLPQLLIENRSCFIFCQFRKKFYHVQFSIDSFKPTPERLRGRHCPV